MCILTFDLKDWRVTRQVGAIAVVRVGLAPHRHARSDPKLADEAASERRTRADRKALGDQVRRGAPGHAACAVGASQYS